MKRALPWLLLALLAVGLAACASQSNDNGGPAATPAPSSSDPWDQPGGHGDDDADDDSTPGGYNPPFDPQAPGPYLVGNTTREFIDPNRHDFWGERKLLVDIWYPAGPEAADMPFDTVDKFLGKWTDLVVAIFGAILPPDEVQNFYQQTRSVRDAPMADGGPWPVIIFSHGNGGVRFQNMRLCEHLASHGFVVISPDHTGNAAVAPLPEKLIIFNPIAMPFEFWWRMDDLSYLLTVAAWLNNEDNLGFFTGRLDPDHSAFMGHSFGAVAALEQSKHDHRISAVVSLAGFTFPIGEDQHKCPGLFFWAGEDRTLSGLSIVQAMEAYEKMPTTKMWIQIHDAGHYSFTDVCDLVPTLMGTGDGCGQGVRWEDGSTFTFLDHLVVGDIMNYYITGFLGWTLRGDDMWPSMIQNIMPDQITQYWTLVE
jgi:predicted dienelactone hydrolase